MNDELKGKTALVTGSGRNIGRAIALEFAARGANVIVNVRSNADEGESVADEARARGVEAIVAIGDISRQEVIDEVQSQVKERFGAVDIYVSNAAVRPYQSFFDMPVEDWLDILNVQLNASFRLAKAFTPGMVEKGWGRIIHITGPDAFRGEPNRAHNVAAKGGLRALTKALAIELGPFGITVNDVAPGSMNTVKNEAGHPQITAADEDDPHLIRTNLSDKSYKIPQIPVRRLGECEDMAYACAFLASPRAGFFTGLVLPCNGGDLMVP